MRSKENQFDVNYVALTSLAKRISGSNDVTIQYIEHNELVYTDCKFIYLPYHYTRDIKSSQGLVAHEAGHIGYGSFELNILNLKETLMKKYNLSIISVEKILNVIEDVRIDLINKKKFPGFHENLFNLTQKRLPEVKRQMELHEDIITYIYLSFEGFHDYSTKPEFPTLKITDEDWNAITKLYEFLSKRTTSAASIICCDLMCKILKKYVNEPKERELEKLNRFNEDRVNFSRQFDPDPFRRKNQEKSELEKISQKIVDALKKLDLKPESLSEILKCAKNMEKDIDTIKNQKCSQNQETKLQVGDIKKEDTNSKLISLRDDPYELKSQDNYKKRDKEIEYIAGLIKNASDLMNKRMIKLEIGDNIQKLIKGSKRRKVIETPIENENMEPVGMLYAQIKQNYANTIKKMKSIFEKLKTTPVPDNFQKAGRFNNKLIKAVTSNYQYRQCFTRKIRRKELSVLLIVDISGSMHGPKQRSAKLAMVVLSEALESIAKVRIVLFTGTFDAINILVKDFNEPLNPLKIDKYGRHRHYGENLDGVSIRYESEKIPNGTIIIVVSDGQPAGSDYGLYDAIPDIHYVRKIFKTYAFSIDASGEYLRQLYGKDWILTSSHREQNLAEKIINLCQIIVKEFYR